jgi:hypothetical protein
MTVEDEILEGANLTRELANKMRIVNKTLDGANRLWEMARPCPGNDKMQVLAVFVADEEDSVPGDMRVYAVPLANDLPFMCNTVNRESPGFYSEHINDREVFLDAISGELSALAVSQGLLEVCPNEECGTPNRVDAKVCIECGESLEEEEEETAETATTTPPTPVANTVAP